MHIPLVVIGSTLLLAGCATIKPYQRPTALLPATYPHDIGQSPSGNFGAAATNSIAASGEWWRQFHEPRLDRLVDAALAANLDIESAAARLQEAAAATRSARAASLPSISVGGTAAIEQQSLNDPATRNFSRIPGFQRTVERYDLSGSAAWEIDLFGGLAAGRRAAAADQAAAAAELAGARLTVAAELTTAYLTVRELQERLAVAQARVATLQDLDRVVQLRVTRGIAARLEGDQVAADLNTARAAVPALAAGLDAQFNRIDILAGRTIGPARTELGEGIVPAAPGIAVDPPAMLLTRRPDMVAAERQVAAADAQLGQAIVARYPRLTLSGLVSFVSAGFGNLFAADALLNQASSTLSAPLFDAGRNRASVDAARARTRDAVAQYRASVLRAAGEVDDGLSALARDREQATALDASVSALQRARRSSRLAYQAGAVSLIEALDAERRLQLAQDAAATARANAARATVTTFRALGALV